PCSLRRGRRGPNKDRSTPAAAVGGALRDGPAANNLEPRFRNRGPQLRPPCLRIRGTPSTDPACDTLFSSCIPGGRPRRRTCVLRGYTRLQRGPERPSLGRFRSVRPPDRRPPAAGGRRRPCIERG